MTEGVQLQTVSLAEWSEIGRNFSDFSIYQTAAFGEVSADDTGSLVSRVVVRKDGTVIGAAQVRVKKLPFFRSGLAYVYFGPMCRPRGLDDQFEPVLHALRDEFVNRRGLQLRVAPNRWVADGVSPAPPVGWKSLDEGHCQTILVDLSPSTDVLRASLAQKWRNGLNQAEKRQVWIESRSDDAAMIQFEKLYDQMWSRKQFETGVTVSSFRRLQQLLVPGEKLAVLMAYSNGALVAGHVSSMLGDSCIYLLGAASEEGRACKASYALQWHALIAAREAGMHWYDLGGVDSVANPGVFHFKSGLGGTRVRFIGPVEAPARGIGRFLIPLAERAYRAIRKHGRSHGASKPEPPKPLGTSCPSVPKLSS